MYTGKNNINNLGTIFSWNNSTNTGAYPGSCGEVRGSSDGLFPPDKTAHSSTISLFSTDLCRPLHFVKHGQAEMHGIPVNTFHLATNNFANTSVCPDNHCYHNDLPTGVQVGSPNTTVYSTFTLECDQVQERLPCLCIQTSFPPGRPVL